MEHIVTQQEDGMRLRDRLRRVMDVSYTAMKSAKWEARILVDGQTRTVDRPVHAGETVLFLPAEVMPAYQPKPCNRPVHIVYEDEYLLVVDKDAPLASQSSERQPDDTLENMLFAYFGCPKQFVYRPVNRLDKGTSGLMVVAKSAHAQYQLQRLLHTPAFRRIYLAVVEGSLPRQQGVIDAPIAKENAASIRRLVCPEGKQSIDCASYRKSKRPYRSGFVRVRFHPADCRVCRSRTRCTRAAKSGRHLNLYPQHAHEALVAARARERTAEYRQL